MNFTNLGRPPFSQENLEGPKVSAVELIRLSTTIYRYCAAVIG